MVDWNLRASEANPANTLRDIAGNHTSESVHTRDSNWSTSAHSCSFVGLALMKAAVSGVTRYSRKATLGTVGTVGRWKTYILENNKEK